MLKIMNEEVKRLIKVRETLCKWLDNADRRNDLFACEKYSKALDKIEKEIQEKATEEELEELHRNGLI